MRRRKRVKPVLLPLLSKKGVTHAVNIERRRHLIFSWLPSIARFYTVRKENQAKSKKEAKKIAPYLLSHH